jgi:hypothetical protein
MHCPENIRNSCLLQLILRQRIPDFQYIPFWISKTISSVHSTPYTVKSLSFPDNSFSRICRPISMVPERILFQLWLPHLLFSRINYFFFRPPTKMMNRGFTVPNFWLCNGILWVACGFFSTPVACVLWLPLKFMITFVIRFRPSNVILNKKCTVFIAAFHHGLT